MANPKKAFLCAVVAYIGFQNALAAPCSEAQLMGCISLISGSTDLKVICSKATELQTCIAEATSGCEVSAAVQSMIDSQSQSFQACKSLSGPCSLTKVMTCMTADTDGSSDTSGKVMDENYCKKIEVMQKCLEPFKSCTGEVKAIVDRALNSSEDPNMKTMCACPQKKMQMCANMMAASKEDNPVKMCHASVEFMKCMHDVRDACTTEAGKKMIDQQLKEIPSFDHDCCDSMDKARVCSTTMREISESFNVSEKHCDILQKTYICVNNIPPKCRKSEGLKEGLQAVMVGLDSKEGDCGKGGYKIDKAAKSTGGNASMIHPSLALLLMSAMTGLLRFQA